MPIFSSVTALTRILSSFNSLNNFCIRRNTLQTMHFQSITVAAAFFSAVAAIPCSDIGWSTGNSPPLDPFDPQGRWEVVKANDCWVRFQTFRPDQNPKDVRVTKTEFTATPAQVAHTINNYFGSPNNIMLWLPLSTKSLQYVRIVSILNFYLSTLEIEMWALFGERNVSCWSPRSQNFRCTIHSIANLLQANILPPKISEDHPVVEGQSSIKKDRTVLSISKLSFPRRRRFAKNRFKFSLAA